MKSRGLSIIKDYFVLTLACFIFAMCWECFMIPNSMSAGGLMGLCTIIQYATGGLIQAQYSYLAINVLLIVLAIFAMGIGFGFKTLYCIIMSSAAMQIVSALTVMHCIPGSFFFVQERVLIPVIAGVLEAVGIGLVLRYGGSTGGTDIVALMINKYWPISLSTAFLVLDLTVCSLMLFLPDKCFSDMCYGIEELVTFSLMIDFVVGGKKSSYQIMVFSDKYDSIADYIINEMGRGVTVLKAQGWYTKKDKNALLILINQKEFPALSNKVKEIDSRALMSVSPTSSVYGEGFDEIKSGFKLNRKKSNESEG